jgi:hypothetical protein
MKRPNRYLLTYIWTIAFDLLMWLLVLIVWLFSGTKLHWCDGLWCEVKRGSFLAKTWAVKWAGLTLGHGGIYGPDRSGGDGLDTKVELHEHVHVEQYEAAMLASQVIGIAAYFAGAAWWMCLAIWLLGGAWAYGAALVQAWLRGEEPYRGSHLEESAYAQTLEDSCREAVSQLGRGMMIFSMDDLKKVGYLDDSFVTLMEANNPAVVAELSLRFFRRLKEKGV